MVIKSNPKKKNEMKVKTEKGLVTVHTSACDDTEHDSSNTQEHLGIA